MAGRGPGSSYDEAMDVIGSHAARLPALDERWTPSDHPRDELVDGLLAGAVAGPAVTHPLDNVLRNIRLLHEGDPDKQFGMSGLQTLEPDEVLRLVGRASGFEPDPAASPAPSWTVPAGWAIRSRSPFSTYLSGSGMRVKACWSALRPIPPRMSLIYSPIALAAPAG